MSRAVSTEQCPKCAESGRDTARDNCVVYADGSKHCFANCGYHKFPTHYVRKTNEEVLPENKRILPADFSREVPVKAWKWLLQYGLGYKYWEPYCGYSEKDQRLIFTVGTPMEFSIGRFIEGPGDTPDEGKGHEQYERRKWYCYGDAHKTAHVFGSSTSSTSIVLVEDLISAHKVGQITSCIPLFGTNIFPSVISTLRLYQKPVIMWLDKDQRDHAIKRAARLSMLTGCQVDFKFTDHDPKALSFKQIEEVIK